MKNFYIVQRDGFIVEVPFNEEHYKAAMGEQVKKGIIVVKPRGHTIPISVNSVDVKNVMTEEMYRTYIDSVKPRQYLMNGYWRDGKENQVIRIESWKQKEIDDQNKIGDGKEDRPATPEEEKNIAKIKKEIRKSFPSKRA